MNFVGSPGDDVRNGTPDADVFNLTQGGNDTARGFAGNDLFLLGSHFNALDKIDGGTGDDVLMLNGNYSAGVVFGAETLVRVQTIQLGGNFSYSFTSNNATIPNTGSLIVDASALVAGESLTFNGASETTGFFEIIGGRGADSLIGGLNGDVFDLSRGGSDTASGGGGSDDFFLGGRLNAGDRIDGGDGFDELRLAGPTYAAGVTLAANTLLNVERILFDTDFSYRLTAVGDSIAGNNYVIDGSAFGPGHGLSFSLADETSRLRFIGGAGNDVFVGGGGWVDKFDLTRGGRDVAQGGAGIDFFTLGKTLTALDKISGGADIDRVFLDGDYNAGIVFNANTMRGIEGLILEGGDFRLTTHDSTVAAGEKLSVGTARATIFDGSAETDGSFSISATGGDDRLTGGAGDDEFRIGNFAAGAVVNGGAGDDTLRISGNIVFNALTVRLVETLFANAVVTHDATVAAGKTLKVFARDFDGSAELNGRFDITGGGGALTGGAGDDRFKGGSLADTLTGGDGADTFDYVGTSIIAVNRDTINAFDFTEDLIRFKAVTAIDAAVNSGAVSNSTFAADIAAAIGAAELGAGHALLFRPDAGDQAGKRFLIVDGNDTAGYQANADLVIHLNGPLNLGSIGIEDFVA